MVSCHLALSSEADSLVRISFFPLILWGPLQVSGDPEFGTGPEAFLHSEDGAQQAKSSGGRGGAALQ